MRIVLDPNGLGGLAIQFHPQEVDVSIATLQFLIEYGEREGWDTSVVYEFLTALETPTQIH